MNPGASGNTRSEREGGARRRNQPELNQVCGSGRPTMRPMSPDRSVGCRNAAWVPKASQLGSEASQATCLTAGKADCPPDTSPGQVAPFILFHAANPGAHTGLTRISRGPWRTMADHGGLLPRMRTAGDGGRRPDKALANHRNNTKPGSRFRPDTVRLGRKAARRPLGMQAPAAEAVSRWLPGNSATRRS